MAGQDAAGGGPGLVSSVWSVFSLGTGVGVAAAGAAGGVGVPSAVWAQVPSRLTASDAGWW